MSPLRKGTAGNRLRVSVDSLDENRLRKTSRPAIYEYESRGASRSEAAGKYARENNLPSGIRLNVEDDETRGKWRHSWSGRT